MSKELAAWFRHGQALVGALPPMDEESDAAIEVLMRKKFPKAGKTQPIHVSRRVKMALDTLPQGQQDEQGFIVVEGNKITFQIQDGPIRENGVNGCQVDDVIRTARDIITGLNERFPCRENSVAITKLQEAEMWLLERKRERERRGVEGFNKA